jgi:4-amino-4-deoxy-L-arabinose transferase-like glycosyltransferase
MKGRSQKQSPGFLPRRPSSRIPSNDNMARSSATLIQQNALTLHAPTLVSESSPVETMTSAGVRRGLLLLGIIIFAGLLIRVAAVFDFWGPRTIGGEGAEYARIAENLRNGFGYLGIATPGPELLFPPLFPLLISLASIVTGNYEWAGRVIAILFGAALPLPVYGIAARLFGRRSGLAAALLVAIHPLFINLSTSVLSEAPYITLLLSGTYLGLRALDHRSVTRWVMVGATFGLGYLVRQEALLAVCMAVLFALRFPAGSPWQKGKHVLAVLLVFAVLAAPYVVYLYKTTGQLRLDAKSTVNFAIGDRILSGEDKKHTEFAVSDNLEGIGVWAAPNLKIVRETRLHMRNVERFLATAVRRNTPVILDYLSSGWMGAPLLPALALLGLLRRPWPARAAPHYLFVLLMPFTSVLATYSLVHGVFPRYYFALVPFLCIWASNSLLAVKRWTTVTVNMMFDQRHRRIGLAISVLVITGAVTLNLVYTNASVRSLNTAAELKHQMKNVGEWIRRQQPQRVKVMDLGTEIAYYAGADYIPFPYASPDTAIRLLDSAGVDYVILRREVTLTPYYSRWFSGGIPDSRAKLVFESSGPTQGAFEVFQWQSPKTRTQKTAVPLSD